MPRHQVVGLSYCQRHVLAVPGAEWDIQAEWQLRGNPSPEPHNRIRFGLDEIDVTERYWIVQSGTSEPTA